EGTARRVVADDPVLVQIAARGRRKWVAPGQATIGRTTGHHAITVHSAGFEQRQRRDQPDVVSGIEGDRGIRCAVVRATARPLGYARQQTAGPRRAVVRGRREANGTGAAVEDASNLKRGDDGRSVRERVGLHFGVVIGGTRTVAGRLRERIRTDV